MNQIHFLWKVVLSCLLALFFLVGAIGNIFALGTVMEDYARWGYPGWFHYATGGLELTAALLLVRSTTRFLGTLLAGLVMLAAIVTVVVHGEYTHAIAPLTVLAVACVVAWSYRPKRSL